MFYVAWGIGNLAQVVGAALEIDDEDAVQRCSRRLAACQQHLEGWVRRASGRVIADLGSAGIIEISPDHDEALGLADVVEQLNEYLGGMNLSFGVGMSCGEAWRALRQAAQRGEPYRIYEPGKEEENEPDDLEAELERMAKAEQPTNVKAQIREALKKIKDQAAAFEILKEKAPEAYLALERVIMAMVMMSHQMSGDMEKAESVFKKLAAGRFPAAATRSDGGGASNLNQQKKSKPVDPLTGQAQPNKWHSVRSGQVMGTGGGVVPSREPNQP